MTFPASVTRALALPSRQGSPEVCAHSPTTPLAAGRHTTWALPRTACAHLQQPGNAPNHPAATRRQLFPPRSCRLRQIKPNKEPALGCGLVHRSVSSACGPNRSSLLQQRRPQAEETSIDHRRCSSANRLKTIVKGGRSSRTPEKLVLPLCRATRYPRCPRRLPHSPQGVLPGSALAP